MTNLQIKEGISRDAANETLAVKGRLAMCHSEVSQIGCCANDNAMS